MARARATDSPRAKSKAAALEELARGMKKLAEIAATIEDCTREGFPYRDGGRAKAELQLREQIRRLFGEQSEEFLVHQQHVVRIGTPAEAQISLDLIKVLLEGLERKKAALQQSPPITEPSPDVRQKPVLTVVPPSSDTSRDTAPPAPVSSDPVPATQAWPPAQIQVDQPETPRPVLIQTPPPPPAPVAGIEPKPVAPITAAAPVHVSPPLALEKPARPRPETASSTPPPAPPSEKPAEKPLTRLEPPMVQTSPQPTTQPKPAPSPTPAASTEPTGLALPAERPTPLDPLASVRTVCRRFHAVVRQLRLRKDYRPTLEVDDDLDLQDLLAALLKLDWEELGSEEWTPAYAQGTARTAFLLDQDRIVMIAYKTRPGLPSKDLAERITTDTQYFASRNRHRHLLCFVYDPEGRIGNPRRFETDCSTHGDRWICEVVVAPQS